jgi:hypothetical protein
MRFDEIKEQYPNEWVLIEFTELDDELKVADGKVIAHSGSRDEIEKELMVLKNGKIAVEYTGEWDPDEALAMPGMNFLREFDIKLNFKQAFIEI